MHEEAGIKRVGPPRCVPCFMSQFPFCPFAFSVLLGREGRLQNLALSRKSVCRVGLNGEQGWAPAGLGMSAELTEWMAASLWGCTAHSPS